MKHSYRKTLALLLAGILTILTFSGCSLFQSSQSGSLSDVSSDMYSASWWISKTKKSAKVLLEKDDIQTLNQTIAANTDAPSVDFSNYSHRFSALELQELLHADRLSEIKLYNSLGDLFDVNFYQDLQNSMNLDAITDEITVGFAILVRDTELRTYPSLSTAYESDDSNATDVFDAGTLLAGTPVAVLHTSSEETWCFVQSENSVGWVIMESLAMMDTSAWNSYISSKNYLVITGLSVTPEYSSSNGIYGQTFSMGTCLPLCTDEEAAELVNGRSTAGCYVVKFPLQDRFGESTLTALLIPYSEDVHVGYLPYSRQNLLKQAMKYVGRTSSATGMDGSLMLQSIFAVFGIELPHTLKGQASLSLNTTSFDGMTASERTKALRSLPCGTLLFTSEQAALVLGTVKGRTYALTVLEDCYEKDGRTTVNASVIAPLNLVIKRDGSTLQDTLLCAESLLSDEKKAEQTSAVSSTAATTTTALVSSVASSEVASSSVSKSSENR